MSKIAVNHLTPRRSGAGLFTWPFIMSHNLRLKRWRRIHRPRIKCKLGSKNWRNDAFDSAITALLRQKIGSFEKRIINGYNISNVHIKQRTSSIEIHRWDQFIIFNFIFFCSFLLSIGGREGVSYLGYLSHDKPVDGDAIDSDSWWRWRWRGSRSIAISRKRLDRSVLPGARRILIS